jgi:hypothetical protein
MSTNKHILKITVTLVFSVLFSISLHAQMQWGWARSIGGTNDDSFQNVVTDSKNGVYTLGNFKSTSLLVGTTTLTNTGGYDVVLVKYDTLGNVIWAQSFGGTSDDIGYSITTDKSSNIIIVGSFKNSINFGGTTLTSAGGSDAFFVKLNSNGTIIWAKQNTAGSLEDKAEVVKADKYNNIYAAGRYKSNDFTIGGEVFTTSGLTTTFYCKLDSNGNFLWKKRNVSNSGIYYLYDLEFLNNNNTTVLMAGHVTASTGSGQVNFNPGIFFTPIITNYSTTFQVRIDSAGNYVSQNSIGLSRQGSGGITVSKDAKIQECGYHISSTNNTPHGNSVGNFGYNANPTDTEIFSATDITVSNSNRLFSIGDYHQSASAGPINFNNGISIPATINARGGVFVWELDSFAISKAVLYDSSSSVSQQLTSIALDTTTNIMYAAGYFSAASNTSFQIGNNTLVSVGQADAFIVKIKVLPVPLNNIFAGNDTTICSGNIITIGSTAGATGGTSPYTYSWNPTTNLTSPNSASTLAAPVITTSYIITVTDFNLNTVKDTLVVTVNPGPIPLTPIVSTSGATAFCSGDSVILTSNSASGVAGYLWSNGATTASITVKISGNYSVRTKNVAGCFSNPSVPVTVTVNTATTPFISLSMSNIICQGQSNTLTSSTATGNLWSTGATTQSITVTTQGNYFVTHTNSFGCSATSASIAIGVQPTPPTPFIITSGPTSFCEGDSVILTSSAGSGYSNWWSTNEYTQSIVVKTSGVISLRILNVVGCYSAYVYINIQVTAIPSVPVITAAGPTTFCQGASVTLTSSAASGHLWSTGATTQSIVVSTSGNYSVKTIGASGCYSNSSLPTVVTVNSPTVPVITASGPTTFCQGGSVTLTSSTATGNVWSNGATTQSIVVNTSGNYTVTYTNGFGCSAISSTIAVTVNAVPTAPLIAASGPTTFCQGGSVTLTSSTATGNVWSTGATTQSIVVNTSGNYTVTYTNGFGCSAISSAIAVTVNAIPTAPLITASGPTTFCQGGSVTLTSSTATGNVWSTGATTQSIVVNTSGNYTASNSNGFGCIAVSSVVSVTVNAQPIVPIITQSGNILTSSAINGNQWFLNNVAIPGANTQSYTYATAGQYSVSVTNANGCISFSQPISAFRMIGTTLNNGDVFQYNVYPNPTRQNANISYNLVSPSDISITIIGGNSNRNTILLTKQRQAAGIYNLNFSSKAALLSSAVYFIVFEINGERVTSKFIKE